MQDKWVIYTYVRVRIMKKMRIEVKIEGLGQRIYSRI